MSSHRVVLPCMCAVVVHHIKGERLVVCPGGGLTPAAPLLEWDTCPGGRGYVVTAETVDTVLHTVRPLAIRADAS